MYIVKLKYFIISGLSGHRSLSEIHKQFKKYSESTRRLSATSFREGVSG
jgi:hypothetical protein